MAAIRSGNTKPELIIRRGLHRLGLRFRLHDLKLPGRPDLVFPRHRVVIRVNGCFWHGHDCPAFRLPKTRQDWWKAKIDRNRQRDQQTKESLERDGWLVVDVWECEVRGKSLTEVQALLLILDATVRHRN